MDRTVPEMAFVNLMTTQGMQDFIVFINDVKKLIGGLTVFLIHDVRDP
jgi:hypothetical protein